MKIVLLLKTKIKQETGCLCEEVRYLAAIFLWLSAPTPQKNRCSSNSEEIKQKNVFEEGEGGFDYFIPETKSQIGKAVLFGKKKNSLIQIRKIGHRPQRESL